MANSTAQTPTGATASTGTSSKERDLDALSDQIATLRNDLSALTEMVGDIGTRRGREAKAKAKAKADDLRGQGEEMLLQSRAMDSTGYVQPTKDMLRKVRGENSIYHNNGIQTWAVNENGEAENVEVS